MFQYTLKLYDNAGKLIGSHNVRSNRPVFSVARAAQQVWRPRLLKRLAKAHSCGPDCICWELRRER